jgi:hypothetical protein
MAKLVVQTFGFDEALVQASSLEDYIKSQPEGSRPWQKCLITSNQKVTDLGIKMKTLEEGLATVIEQMRYPKENL